MSFCLLVPVKSHGPSKTRLDVAALDRAAAMAAFARDALAAARATSAVERLYVVTDGRDLAGDDLELLPDHGGGDLNAALRHAERTARLRHPRLAVAALCADLPALRAEDLEVALDLSLAGTLGPRWFVADADGTGTTMLAAAPGVGLDPHFGPGSAAAHEASGATSLRAAVPTLRRDVDTAQDLRAATDLGLGPSTRDALAAVPGPADG